MLASGAGRSVVRLLPKSTLGRLGSVESCPTQSTRVAAAYSTFSKDTRLCQAIHALRLSSNGFPHIGRSFATRAGATSKPKAHTGRTTTKPREKKVAVAEGEAKKDAGTKAPKKKTASAAKAKPKPKPKAKPKKKVVKPLTEAQKAKVQIRELRETALKAPKRLPDTAYMVINTELSRERGKLSPQDAKQKLDNLAPEEREHYNHLAVENKVKNQAAYKHWVLSYPPHKIRAANNARQHLKRLKVKGYQKIQDDRQIKSPTAAHSLFLRDRHNSGEMRGIDITEATKIIHREWKELPHAEKQVYLDEEQRLRRQYAVDVKRVYGRDAVMKENSPAAAAPAA